MSKETNNKSILVWLEEIWEEIEIQFYGIIGALLFFLLLYLFIDPPWMRPLIDFFKYL